MKVLDVIMMGNSRLWEAFQERDRLYEGEMTDAVGMRSGSLKKSLRTKMGIAQRQMLRSLVGAGIPISPKELHGNTMGTIPTDMQFRALLCRALFGIYCSMNPQTTSTLSRSVVGKFLHYTGTLIVVSHDRHFLTLSPPISPTSITTRSSSTPVITTRMIATKSSVRERTETETRSKEKKIAQLREVVVLCRNESLSSAVATPRDRAPSAAGIVKSNIQRPYIRFPSLPELRKNCLLSQQHLKRVWGA